MNNLLLALPLPLEVILTAAVIVISFARPLGLPSGARWAARFARHRALAVIGVGMLAGALSVGLSLVRPPVPSIHDEFCYLLAADTFAHGRLANPTHPMWQHFETFHVIQQPTYAAKYPPGQGLFLAGGQVLTGRPIAGVWLSTALAAAAVCWMLLGWVPGRWALLGGAMAALHIGMQRHWGHTFWGTNVALLGGALLYGALPRILRDARPAAAAVMGLGLVILAVSRPYEGLVLGLPVAAILAGWLIRANRPPIARVFARVVLPASAVLLIGGVGWAYYNYRTTGDPRKMPYQVHRETYAVAPSFLWGSLRPEPDYRHREIAVHQAGWEVDRFTSQRQNAGALLSRKSKDLAQLAFFVCRVILLVPLLAVPWLLRSRRVRFPALILLLAVGAGLLTVWCHPRYFAPAVPLLFLLVIQVFRELRLWTFRGRPSGRFLVAGTVAVYFATTVLSHVAFACTPAGATWAHGRASLVEKLQGTPGRHLVIVRYLPEHDIHQEWVYNGADIDGAKVVFAREMGSRRDWELLDYFSDRQVWLVEPDLQRPRFTPYPRSALRDTAASGGLEAARPDPEQHVAGAPR